MLLIDIQMAAANEAGLASSFISITTDSLTNVLPESTSTNLL